MYESEVSMDNLDTPWRPPMPFTPSPTRKGIFSISEHGTFKASVYGADLESKVAVLRDPSQPGRPSVRSLGCHSSVRDVSISIHGGSLAWIVNLFHDAIAARIRDELPSIICAETNDAIDVQLNRALKVGPGAGGWFGRLGNDDVRSCFGVCRSPAGRHSSAGQRRPFWDDHQ
jgi:hypothetical protein